MAAKKQGRVLVGVDFESDWRHVVARAVQHAERSNRGLDVVHVVSPKSPHLERAMGKKDLRRHLEGVVEESRSVLESELPDLLPTALADETRLVVEVGPVEEIVLASVEQLQSDVLVIGASVNHEDKGLFSLGTVADRLLRSSSIPVLAVAHGQDGKLGRILVPTDCDKSDRGALAAALGLASVSKARVSVLHAYERPSLLHGYLGNIASIRRELKDEAAERLEDFVATVRAPEGTKAVHKLLAPMEDKDGVASVILRHASRLEMDLIVIGLDHHGLIERLVFSQITEKLLRGLPCDLLALPAPWTRQRRALLPRP